MPFARPFLPTALSVLGVLSVLATAPASGQPTFGDYEDVRELPDTPAARRAAALLETVNSGDRARFAEFVREAFAPEFRDAFPIEEHVSQFARVHDQSRGLDLHGWRRYDPPRPETDIVLILRNRLTESWEAFVVSVEPDPPHRIRDLQFARARPPSDLPALPELSEAEIVAELSQFVKRVAEADAFSGTVLLARDGRVLFETATGLASRRFGVANDLETRFNLGSMNKMITAVAMAQLVERGRLSFDDSLATHLDATWLEPAVAEPIRISHLLNHTSGLGSYFNDTFWEASRMRFLAVDDYKVLVAGETSAFTPGTAEQYSNTGFLLLGAVIEAVTGEDYFEYVRRNVYEPAGMTASDSYEMDLPVPNLAIGYRREPGPGGTTVWRNNLYMHVIKGGPAGGGFSTVGDLLRFDQALRSGALLSAGSTDVLWTAKPVSPGYGYGFGITETPRDRIVGHGGGFPGISGRLDMYLDSGFTVAVLSNDDGAAGVVADRARELILRRR